MAPFLDSGILHHADMNHHQAAHERLSKLFSNGTPSPTDNRPLGNNPPVSLAEEAFLVVSKAAPPESPSLEPHTIKNTQHKEICVAKTRHVPDDLESHPIIDAAKAPAPPSSLDGSESLSGVSEPPPTATRIPITPTNGAEQSAQVPEPKQHEPDQATTPNPAKAATPARGAGVPGVESGVAKDGAKSTNSATSGIQHQQPGTCQSGTKHDRLRELAESISRSVDTLSSSNGPEFGARNGDSEAAAKIQLVAAANELVDKVRPGPDAIMGWFAQMSVVSAVNVFLHWGVFDFIPPQQGAVISFRQLAERVGAEEGLLVRMSWMLTSSSVLLYIPSTAESGSDTGGVSHTPTSLLLRSQSPLSSMFKLLHKNIVETSAIMPSYFDTYGRKEPIGPGHIPTSYLAGQPELAYFDLLNQSPERVKGFMHAMSIQHRRSPITGMFDLSGVITLAEQQMEQLQSRGKLKHEQRPPVWVDIGGSDGAVVKTFRETYPGLKAEWCVVQDLPLVVEAARDAARDDALLRGVRFCPLDFHSEAPVAGALVYYLRHIVRDYSDPVVINILSNIRKSMIPPGRQSDSALGSEQAPSRILISEQLIPTPPPLYAAFKDYAMLAVGGKERSLGQFEAVAEAAGLIVTGVYRDKGTPHAVIEMQVKVW